MNSEEKTDRLARKAVHGSITSGGAAIVTFALGFIRAIVLARLLLPEDFGVVALAVFFVELIHFLINFGLDSAMIHCQNPGDPFKRTYFSLRCSLSTLITSILILAAPTIQNLYPHIDHLKEVLVTISILSFVEKLCFIQTTMMQRDLLFSRLALIDVIASVVMTIVAPGLAWLGWGLWAIVAEKGSGIITRFLLTWGPFRQWQPKFGWDSQAITLFGQFGKPVWIKMNLGYLLSKFDDFWVGTMLGQAALGFYEKAYYFACAPRRIFALPLYRVFVPIFAKLQQDRKGLSKAFFQCTYPLIRLVFFGAGLFALVIPEFIELVIGPQWYPILLTFRLLLGFAVMDSFLVMISGLFFAIGKPNVLKNATLIQVLFFFPLVILGSAIAGINGVALAADITLFIGILLLYRPLTQHIDISFLRLFLWPTFALASAFTGGAMVIGCVHHTSIWLLVCLKLSVFSIIFWAILMTAEWPNYTLILKKSWFKTG